MMGKCLFIIDVQIGFINQHTQHIPSYVEGIQPSFEHIFCSRFVNAKNSPFREIMGWQKFEKGSDETALAFSPYNKAHVFDKYLYTCVSEDVIQQLKRLQINEVYLSGIDTDCCILKTAVDFFEKGIRPIILSKACASHGGVESHQAGLKVLERLIGHDQVQ